MSEEYSRSILKIAIGKICQNVGWVSITKPCLDILIDILQRYLEDIGRTSHAYSEQCEYLTLPKFTKFI